jgi:hypothetical protein
MFIVALRPAVKPHAPEVCIDGRQDSLIPVRESDRKIEVRHESRSAGKSARAIGVAPS